MNIQILQALYGYFFCILKHFRKKLTNFNDFVMFFPAVVKSQSKFD